MTLHRITIYELNRGEKVIEAVEGVAAIESAIGDISQLTQE